MSLYKFRYLGALATQVGEERLQAVNDTEALEIARLFARSFGIEVWQRDRRVGVALPSGWAIPLDYRAVV
jgi:hypothetical protein